MARAMITIEDEDYFRKSLLLLKGGGMVSEEILNREVTKSEESIDESLGTFKQKLEIQFHKKQMQVLYPTSGATNIKDWDIQTITGVLLTVFKKGLDKEEKEAIQTIKSVHNETSSTPLKPLTHSENEDTRKKLVAALECLSSKLDKPIPNKCKELIKECTESRLDAATAQKLLKGIRGTEEKTNEILDRLYHISNELKQNNDEHEKTRKDRYSENEKSNNARQDTERPASDSDVNPSFGCKETEEEKSGNQIFQIDTKVWERCIDSKDIQEADRLVNERILPDQDLLDRATDLFGMSSKTVKSVCDSICLYLKENVQQIVSVNPAIDCRQKSTRKHITFVIFTAHPSVIGINEYRCYPRCLHETPSSLADDENIVIDELEEDCQKDWSEAEKIREIIIKHSKSLMDHHTNITRISLSWIKSKGHGTKDNDKTKKTCIAVNVRAKGFVPINEDVLPKTIDEIDVDIREGVIVSYGGPHEHHDNLKMGCAIQGCLEKKDGTFLEGTLGGFVETDAGLCCISCAHIFLSSGDMLKLEKSEGRAFGKEVKTFEVYQPCNKKDSQAFGKGIKAVYNGGGNGAVGVGAVLIKVDRRLPISGEFPECPSKGNTGVKHQTFSSGKMYNRDEVKRLMKSEKRTVVKFGCTSGWTEGKLRSVDVFTRLEHYDRYDYFMCHQIEVERIGDRSFAELGDSGALVFTDENDQLSAIGIIEGGMGPYVYITPIFEVFAALGLEEGDMKKFSLMQNERIPFQSVDEVSSHNSLSSSHSEIATTLTSNLEKKN